MTKTKSRKRLLSPGFLIGLSIYSLILIVAAFLGLKFFTRYIEAYELTRPETAIKTYLAEFNKEYLRDHAANFFAQLDQNVQSPEVSLDRVYEAVQEPTYARLFDPDGKVVYVLKNGDQIFDTVSFEQTGDEIMGFIPWQISSEEFDLDYLCSATELTVPKDYSVICGGYTLGETYVADDNVEYQLLSEFYETYPDFPTMVTYRTGSYIGDIEYQVLDGSGNSVAELNEAVFTDNCTDEEKALVESFINDYVERYVTFLSAARGGYLTYGSLRALILDNSPLYERVSNAAGLGFVESRSDVIDSITVNEVMKVSDDSYACSITYLVTTKGWRDYVTTTNNCKMLLTMTRYGLRGAFQVFV